MTDRWFYVFLTFTPISSFSGYFFVRKLEFVTDSWMAMWLDVGAVVGAVYIIVFVVLRMRGDFEDQ